MQMRVMRAKQDFMIFDFSKKIPRKKRVDARSASANLSMMVREIGKMLCCMM